MVLDMDKLAGLEIIDVDEILSGVSVLVDILALRFIWGKFRLPLNMRAQLKPLATLQAG